MEVSCLSSRKGRISILPRQACAIESAAVTNPDYDVYVLFASRGVIEDQGSLSDYLINILLSYHNVKFLHIDMDSLIHGSIVERLYTEQKVQKSVYPMNINGNIMRLLVLQKYGGLYLDLDVIVLTNFDVLPSNLKRKNFNLPRQACAIESAAVTNPDYDVYVLFASRGVIEDQGSLSDYLINILLSYHNVKFLHIDMDSLIHGSIVERLYREQKVQKSAYPMNINGNIMRLLVLQKYGGLYLDLDVIVLTNFDVLPSNLVGIQSKIAINNAVMRVDDGDVGKNFTKLCLEEIRDHPFGRVWGNTGPRVITKVMKRMCQVNNVKVMPNRSCSGVHVLPLDKFYPVNWLESQKLFETQKSDYLLNKILNTSIVLHLWNKFSHGFVASEAPNSIYNTLANKFCPLVYDVAKNYF
ncbi:hypothetical protein FQR65_LT05477 [Abscondita terminalis]|nr:hypothetical protein FQR65_LT05477 [Abscondita terminalis]